MMVAGGETDEPRDDAPYVDLVAAERAAAADHDVLAVTAHSLLSALSTAMSSLDSMASPATPEEDRDELYRIARRQLAAIDARLRELAGGLPSGSLEERESHPR
jgi:hypothetical protein